MSKFATKLSVNVFLFIILVVAAFINWWQPVYVWFGDTALYRFIWLGIFFVILDIAIEVILGAMEQMRLMAEMIGFGMDLKKISKSFYVIPKAILPNGVRADYIIIGSSGVWLIMVKDDKGKIEFNGDDLTQNGIILKGLLTETLEKSYSLAGLLREKLGREIAVTPVVSFSSHKIDLGSTPKIVRGVYLTLRKDSVALIENTDIQLIDKNTIDSIHKLIKS